MRDLAVDMGLRIAAVDVEMAKVRGCARVGTPCLQYVVCGINYAQVYPSRLLVSNWLVYFFGAKYPSVSQVSGIFGARAK